MAVGLLHWRKFVLFKILTNYKWSYLATFVVLYEQPYLSFRLPTMVPKQANNVKYLIIKTGCSTRASKALHSHQYILHSYQRLLLTHKTDLIFQHMLHNYLIGFGSNFCSHITYFLLSTIFQPKNFWYSFPECKKCFWLGCFCLVLFVS